MKKLLVVLAVVAFCAGFTSCKKECNCKESGFSINMAAFGIDTKKDCEDFEAYYNEDEDDEYKIKCSWE